LHALALPLAHAIFQTWEQMMKSIFPQVAALAILASAYGYISYEADKQLEGYAFDPVKARQNICGPIGTNRSVLFRPEVAKLLSNAAYASAPADADVRLLSGLNTIRFPMSSKNAEAQAYFQQGAALLYAFNHWEAIRAFKKAQGLDPECAICYWGEATALGPNINAGMSAEAGAKALVAIKQAQKLKGYANKREQGLIEAAVLRFGEESAISGKVNDQNYADAMAKLVAEFPGDNQIATLYAEALMDTSPWDYWERDLVTPRPHIKTAIDTIHTVLAVDPNK